jgi:NAD(P)-dependent dehydrogenase (short-subunit alcohol dehydrogenase family)
LIKSFLFYFYYLLLIYLFLFINLFIFIYLLSAGLDVLVNNAGMAYKGNAFNEEVARTTLATNYYGTKNVTAHFLPLIRDYGANQHASPLHLLHDSTSSPMVTFNFSLFAFFIITGRVVNVSSRAGLLSKLSSDALKQAFTREDLTLVRSSPSSSSSSLCFE